MTNLEIQSSPFIRDIRKQTTTKLYDNYCARGLLMVVRWERNFQPRMEDGAGEGILGRCLYQSASSQETKSTPKCNTRNYYLGTMLLPSEPKKTKEKHQITREVTIAGSSHHSKAGGIERCWVY